MNRLMIIGNVGKDATIRDAGNSKVISFSVAHSERYTNKQGETQEKTTWVECSYFRPPDKTGIAQYLKAGAKIYVEGQADTRVYQNSAGGWVASLVMKVERIELLGEKKASAPSNDSDEPRY